jgi:alginate O-acetyltransferase complex protein AlgI
LLFNSIHFVYFFPLVVAVYFITPARWRWALLLAASYYFYAAWKPEYLILIAFSTVVDYACALGMGRWSAVRLRRLLLYASIGTNIGMLFAFKYLTFFNKTVGALFAQFNIFYGVPAFDILLPVGISFYTFQSLSYTIDVYRGRTAPERHFGIFALYVSFFPQLVAGPIERSYRLLPQFFEHRGFEPSRVTSGLRLMLWGFFMKLVIADRLAVFVNEVYADPAAFAASALITGTYFFAFQIFCDFAGYSCIAIGSARVLGYDLMQNFNRPYFATSIRDFWGRWHISLSTWFRDYVYVTLGGNRVGRRRWYANLFIVFAVSGLWHGAAWTFVIWGALHGTYLVVSILTAAARDRAWQTAAGLLTPRSGGVLAPADAAAESRSGPLLQSFPGLAALRARLQSRAAGPADDPATLPAWAAALRTVVAVLVTFHLVLVAWVFFRAGSFGEAMNVLGAVWSGAQGKLVPDGVDGWQLRLSYFFVLLLIAVHVAQTIPQLVRWVRDDAPWFLRWTLDYALIVCIIVFGEFGAQEFIYFQF